MGMFFGPGKRKGFSSFKVVDRSNKTRKSTVQLPSTLPLEKEQHRSVEDVEQGEEEEDPCALCDGEPPDSDDDVVPTSSTSSYKMRKERLHKNWESLRSTLLKFSVEMEGFVPHQCNCGKTVESRCRDCSFTAYFCLDCCNHLHQTKHHFHHPEIIQDGVWKLHTVPDRTLSTPYHSCSFSYTREITVIDERGGQHLLKILCCTCFSVAESFLFQGLWPATPVEPTLAFTTSLMEFTLALVMECQVSIFDLVKALDFYSHPLIKKRKIYDQFIDSFEEFRYHVKALQCFTENEVCPLRRPVCPACPACPKMQRLDQLGCPSVWLGYCATAPERLYSPQMSDMAEDATFTNYLVSTMVNKLSKAQMAEQEEKKAKKKKKQKKKKTSQKSGAEVNPKNGPGTSQGTAPQTQPDTSTGASEGNEVELFDNSNKLVCRGVVTAQAMVHGRALKTGWAAVMIQDILSKGKVEPWQEYPTHSGEVEEGSFVAWPTAYIQPRREALQTARPKQNLLETQGLKDALHPDKFVSPGTIMSKERQLRSRK